MTQTQSLQKIFQFKLFNFSLLIQFVQHAKFVFLDESEENHNTSSLHNSGNSSSHPFLVFDVWIGELNWGVTCICISVRTTQKYFSQRVCSEPAAARLCVVARTERANFILVLPVLRTTDYSLLHNPGYFGATGDCREKFINYQTSGWGWRETFADLTC